MSDNKNTNEVIPKVNAVTNKNKIKYLTAFAAIGFLGVAIAANYKSNPKEEGENKPKEKIISQSNIPANNNINYSNIPDYIDQNNTKKVENNIPNSNNAMPSNENKKNIGDMDVNAINAKQLEAAAISSNTEPERVNQQLKAFAAEKAVEDDEIYLSSRKKAAKSPYQVMAGTFIPAVLETGLNSDLPGYSTAVVRQNVYDTVTGTFLLIPKGTKIFGKYESKIAYGQKRLLLNWNRLIFSDGASISIKGMPGTDKEGYSGFADQVDNHFANLLSGAILMSIIGAGAQLSQPQTSSGITPSQNEVIGQTIAGQAGTQIANITGQVVQKNMNVSPTISIRPGYEFNIIVNKDMILEPISSDN